VHGDNIWLLDAHRGRRGKLLALGFYVRNKMQNRNINDNNNCLHKRKEVETLSVINVIILYVCQYFTAVGSYVWTKYVPFICGHIWVVLFYAILFRQMYVFYHATFSRYVCSLFHAILRLHMCVVMFMFIEVTNYIINLKTPSIHA
jgi:hypothetical protein